MKETIFKYKNDIFNSLEEFFAYYKISKANICLLLNNKGIKINGNIILKVDYKLNKDDEIEINQSIVKNNNYIPWNKKIEVLYEDEDILIVYKPIKMLVHPDGNINETLVNAVSNYYKNSNIIFEHLHRLDYETSGMIVFSKNIFAHSYLSYIWENHMVKKNYICLCYNSFKNRNGIINYSIGKDRHSNNKQIVSEKGKSAITKYKVLKEIDNKNIKISKLDIEIIGGRKHQIRVHLAYINHPILGDDIYGIKDKQERMMLQFYKIEFIHPRTKLNFIFECKQEF